MQSDAGNTPKITLEPLVERELRLSRDLPVTMKERSSALLTRSSATFFQTKGAAAFVLCTNHRMHTVLEDSVQSESGQNCRADDPEDHRHLCLAKQGGTTGDPLVPIVGREDFCFYKEDAQ